MTVYCLSLDSCELWSLPDHVSQTRENRLIRLISLWLLCFIVYSLSDKSVDFLLSMFFENISKSLFCLCCFSTALRGCTRPCRWSPARWNQSSGPVSMTSQSLLQWVSQEHCNYNTRVVEDHRWLQYIHVSWTHFLFCFVWTDCVLVPPDQQVWLTFFVFLHDPNMEMVAIPEWQCHESDSFNHYFLSFAFQCPVSSHNGMLFNKPQLHTRTQMLFLTL